MSFHSGSTFGYTTKGGSTSTLSNIRGSRFTSTQAGLANSISVYLSSSTTFRAQAAIYSGDGSTRIGTTEERTLTNPNGWITFNFVSPPTLAASTNYVLVVWSSDTNNVSIYRDTGTGSKDSKQVELTPLGQHLLPTRVTNERIVSTAPTTPAQYIAEAEFTGQSSTPTPWNDLIWAIDSSATTVA